ncbi:MAG TPA: S16 family serine protease [Jatrophihabitans sp.]|uniref:S16 family serine protease n=1 Tax=Jatrophihabitans sp. TaxID=1932789 RepID=UPI002EDE8175
MRFDAGQAAWNLPTPMRAPAPARRRGWLPVAAVRPDYELIPMNGARLQTPGHERPTPAGAVCAVSYRAELRPSTWELLSHLVDPQAAVVARSRLTGGRSVDDFEAAGLEDSTWSLESATAAAAAMLGEPVRELGRGAIIEAIRDDTVGLRCEDVIIAVNGKTVETAVHLRAALAGLDSAMLTVLLGPEADQPGALSKVSLTRHSDGAWGMRVVTADRVLRHSLDARFSLPDDLRGPSLGLACALSVVDAFTGGRLAVGGTVVATGTVDMTGRVGGVGAIEFKARAVRAHPDVRRFVVPAESGADVDDARRVLGGRVEVVAVATLAEAVEVLCGFSWRGKKITRRSPDRQWASTVR